MNNALVSRNSGYELVKQQPKSNSLRVECITREKLKISGKKKGKIVICGYIQVENQKVF